MHWGRGFDKAQAAFETNNIPFPRVENQFGGTSVYIQRETEAQETEEETTRKSVEKIINATNESPSIITHIEFWVNSKKMFFIFDLFLIFLF